MNILCPMDIYCNLSMTRNIVVEPTLKEYICQGRKGIVWFLAESWCSSHVCIAYRKQQITLAENKDQKQANNCSLSSK